jgi:hypothetical protein
MITCFFSESAIAMWIKCSGCKPNKWTCYLLFFSSVGNSLLLWLCGLCRDAIWSSLLPQACGSGRSLSVWNLPASECVSRMCTRASIQDVIFSDNQVSEFFFERVRVYRSLHYSWHSYTCCSLIRFWTLLMGGIGHRTATLFA